MEQWEIDNIKKLAERLCQQTNCPYYSETGYIYCVLHLHGHPSRASNDVLLEAGRNHLIEETTSNSEPTDEEILQTTEKIYAEKGIVGGLTALEKWAAIRLVRHYMKQKVI